MFPSAPVSLNLTSSANQAQHTALLLPASFRGKRARGNGPQYVLGTKPFLPGPRAWLVSRAPSAHTQSMHLVATLAATVRNPFVFMLCT